LLIQGLTRLDGFESRRGIARVVCKGIGRQTRREVVSHASTVRKWAAITPEIAPPPGARRNPCCFSWGGTPEAV